jgi:hypothetical protein
MMPNGSAMKLAALLVGSLSTTAASQDVLAIDSAGRSAAGIVVGGVLTDEQVRELLRRYNVLPFAVYFTAPAGRHEVPSDQASLELIAEARRRVAQQTDPWICHRIVRLRSMQQSRRNIRSAPGERFSFERLRLSELEMTRSNRERVRRGEFSVYGLGVVGAAEDIRRLASDSRVREFKAGQRITQGARREFAVAGMIVPREETPRTTPEVDALSDEEVSARLERLVSDPPPECRELLPDVAADEPIVRPPRLPGRRDAAFTAHGLVFRAESQLVPASEHRPQPPNTRMPQAVRTVLTVSNPASERVDVGVRGCTMTLRAYRPSGTRGTPAWEAAHGRQCMEAPARLVLGPGESRTFAARTGVWGILGDSLPPGRYAFAAVFRLADQTLEIPAGEVVLPDRLAGLRFRTEIRLVGTELHAASSVTNTTSRAIYLEYGACALRLRAYRSPARSGTPVWRSERRAPWERRGGYACPAYGVTSILAPGATLRGKWREFQLRVPMIEILGDSLLDGRYYFSAVVRLNSGHTREIPSGSVTLALPREPLPSSRAAGSVTYTAATDVVDSTPSPTIRTTVTVLLPQHPEALRRGIENASLRRYSRNCPLVLHAYRDRARRDAAPRSGAPDWTSARDCGTELQEFVLRGDEPRTFEVRARAREILGERLAPGRYYFAVAVHHEHRTIYLSAGEAELRR